MNAIEINSLKKIYDTGIEALKGINLSISQGSGVVKLLLEIRIAFL